ncbi:hypothetical protein NLJ89_g4871 [Agrocybe chaxingu]|uniref:Integrase catalytic domain-containing protein n=1 Tax=Agrocybe chaxingu TaxID=84603 RepID=A0A9W8MXP0_9AGAR|nr:hypothetical protein NLJ89_g4871 [Agrocybe chaxingu]
MEAAGGTAIQALGATGRRLRSETVRQEDVRSFNTLREELAGLGQNPFNLSDTDLFVEVPDPVATHNNLPDLDSPLFTDSDLPTPPSPFSTPVFSTTPSHLYSLNASTFQSRPPEVTEQHRLSIQQSPESSNVRFVDIDVADVWESLTEFSDANDSYDDFKKAVIKLYPDADEDYKYVLADMDRVIGNRQRLGIQSLSDLADYHREFMAITTFLISKQRLATMEQERAFARGFQPEFWAFVAQRLQVKEPDQFPDKPYTIEKVMEAARFVLRGFPAALRAPVPAAISTSSPAPPDSIKLESLGSIFSEFTKTIVEALQQANQSRNTRPSLHSGPVACKFCGKEHYISSCPLVDDYTRAGKCRRNIEGKVVLPSGSFVPKEIPGSLLKDRIDEWHRRNPNQLAAGTLLNSITPSSAHEYATPHAATQPTYQLSTTDRIAALESELFNLRARNQPGFVPTIRTRAQKARAAAEDEGNDAPSAPEPPVPAAGPDNGPEHPFRDVQDATYVPLQDRNIGAVPKPQAPKKSDAAYRTLPPIHDSRIATAVYDRSLNTPVTITQRELLSLSPEIRAQYRESTTTRRQPTKDTPTQAALLEEDPIDPPFPERITNSLYSLPRSISLASSQHHHPPEGSIVIPDTYETYYRSLQPGESPDPDRLVVAMESAALRSIVPLVDNKQHVECILDPGCQIIAMSEEVCHALALIYDPTITLRMQSANRTVDRSLGLARNVAFLIGDITVYMQVHVYATTPTKTRPSPSTIPTRADKPPFQPSLADRLASSSRLITILNVQIFGSRGPFLEAYQLLDSSDPDYANSYFSACNLDFNPTAAPSLSHTAHHSQRSSTISISTFLNQSVPTLTQPSVSPSEPPPISTFASKKKYKPVSKKVRPVYSTVPEKFRIVREIKGDPLETLPALNPTPPPFQPHGRYTQERRDQFDQAHDGFLQPAERDLLHHFMILHQDGFAWNDSERGHFREDFFPPIEIPTVSHTPWVLRNIPIPPGLYELICKLIQRKMDARVFEPSNSSYRSRWFCVVKKDGTSLRIVQSLEPLNAVTIAHSGVPPFTEQLAEEFAARSCGGMLDLYVGYDERALAESSRDLTTFQTPFGALRLTTLPMGWTNSVPIFHDDVTHILRPEIPHVTIPYIDDVPVKGPPTRYIQPDSSFEVIPENPGIRRFVWEHFQNLNRIVQRMKYCGGTFSGLKSILCAPEITVLGHRCTYQGRLPDLKRVAVISNWGPCENLSDIRSFLGTIGVCRLFIRNFAHRAHALTKLTKKDIPFEFGPEQLAAQQDLKNALLASPALRPINYDSDASVILSVDTSFIAVGYILSQCDLENLRLRYFARFGSITLNDRECRFSQPKLELYGLFRALRALKLYLIGLRNLVVKVDAKYIKGMLANPDIAPSASINRWILAILMFHFTLVHVPGQFHGPDGLSRRRPQPGDEPEPDDDFEDWIDNVHGFMHLLNPTHNSISAAPPFLTYASDISPEAIPDPTGTVQPPAPTPDSYSVIPRSDEAQKADTRLLRVHEWHRTLQRPDGMSDTEYNTFMRYCTEFFVDAERLWRKEPHGRHKLVIPTHRRLFIITSAHEDVGHHGFFATNALIVERYWWPFMAFDISWFCRTCHICQLRRTEQIRIPPVVATPAPLFAKVYLDTMFLPPSGGFKAIIQARCSLTHYPEFALLRRETHRTVGEWIFRDLICRYGTLVEIVTDNGTPIIKACQYLATRYHIKHIRISGYNSKANGIAERPHFDVRQALFKAADGDQSKWSNSAHHVFWADRVTVRRRMGCSPYFALTGTHPLLPFDIVEANYLLPPPDSILSTTDLISRRAIALQKRREHLEELHSRVFDARRKAAARFEQEHAHTIRNYNFKLGDLVLVRNTRIEKSLNRKMRARYLGPLIVISRNKGGAYILSELDGTLFDRPIAAFRVIPYFARTSITLPPLDELLDVSRARLQELKNSTTIDPDEDSNSSRSHVKDD